MCVTIVNIYFLHILLKVNKLLVKVIIFNFYSSTNNGNAFNNSVVEPNKVLTRPLASICSAAYTKPPHLGHPSPSGALAIALGSIGGVGRVLNKNVIYSILAYSDCEKLNKLKSNIS